MALALAEAPVIANPEEAELLKRQADKVRCNMNGGSRDTDAGVFALY